MVKKKSFDRGHRVADLIQKTLAQLLLHIGMDEEGFRLVTVTGVEMSRDLSYAKVFVTVLADEEDKIKQVIKSLNQAAKPLRYQVAQQVKLRIAPELRFVYDESTARGFRISTLIDSAIKKAEK